MKKNLAAPRLRVIGPDDSASAIPKRGTRGPILPGIGVTAREDVFANSVVAGASLADSYRRAYDVTEMKDETVWRRANEVKNRGRVQARIVALQAAKDKHSLHDSNRAKAWALERLLHEAENAETAGARVAAVQTVLRMHALLTERVETEVTDNRRADELAEELERRLSELGPQLRRA